MSGSLKYALAAGALTVAAASSPAAQPQSAQTGPEPYYHGRGQHPHHMGGMGMHHPPGHTHWSVPAEAAARPNPVLPDSASIARGRDLYQQRCAPCHGPQARGDGPISLALYPGTPDLSVMASHYADGGLAWKIATGRNFMPGWKNVLNEEQIWDVVNYLRTLTGKN